MTKRLEVNIPLLRKAVEWAEFEAAQPAIDCHWNQGWFVLKPQDVAADLLDSCESYEASHLDALAPHCETTYCIAGYVGQLLNPAYAKNDTVRGVHVAEFARRELGISQGDAEWLFEGSHTIEEVRSVAEHIAGEKL